MPLHGKIVVIKRSGGDGTEFPLTATCLFGRKPDCDIRIQLPQVSKEHCRIDLNENKEVVLTNLSSVNPTRVNGEALQQSERLKHGDVITIIDRSFRFEYPPAPTPKKRSSTGGKAETLKVLQDQQVGDSVPSETGEKRISEVSTDPHLKDGANNDNIQRSLEKTLEVDSKEDGTKTASPFSDLYQMIKKSLDVKTPRKSSASLLQTPTSRFCTPKPTSVRRSDGKPVIPTEDESTPTKEEAKVSAVDKVKEEPEDTGTPKSVKKQRRSFQTPSTETPRPNDESSVKPETTSPQRRNRTPPQRFTVGEVIEQICSDSPKSPKRRKSKEATSVTPSKEAKTMSKKRKSGELAADLPKSQMKKKRVSFGGHLSPELFDKRLPPDSPLRKGAAPRRSLGVFKPKQSLLRRASVIGLLKEFDQEQPESSNKKSPAKSKTPSPKKSSAKSASPKTPTPAKKSPKSKSPSPKKTTPVKASPSPKTATPVKASPKPRSPSPKATTPAKNTPKSRSPSPKAATPAKMTPKSRPSSPKASTPALKTPKSKSPSTNRTQTPKDTEQTPAVQGRFSVSRISTPPPVTEEAVADEMSSAAVTPKLPLKRKSIVRKTPKSAMKAMLRRSGISRASLKAKNSWADIVKFGKPKVQVAAPAKKAVVKKTKKKAAVAKPQTPARALPGHVSTGHACSPATIVVSRAQKQRLVQPTGAAPRLVTNIAVLKKNMNMDEDLSGVSEMFKTPVNEKKRRSVIGESSAMKTPMRSLETPLVEPSVLNTPEEPGEMIVSPLGVASTVKDRHYNSEAVQRLLDGDEDTSFVCATETPSDDPAEEQSTDLETSPASTPKQRPEQPDCLTGVKRMMKTPKQKSEPVEDLRGRLLKTPKQKAEMPDCLTGVKRVMKTPKEKAKPVEDLRGRLLKTPKQKLEQQECLTGVKRMMKTPKQKAEPIEDLRGKILKTPKQKPEEQECLSGVKRMMKTPKHKTEPVEDIRGSLLETPNQKPEELECLSGVERIMQTPQQEADSLEDVSVKLLETPKAPEAADAHEEGVEELAEMAEKDSESEDVSEEAAMKTPNTKTSPQVCLTGIKRIMKTPKEMGTPVEDMVGVKRLLKTPKEKSEPVEKNFGIQKLMKTPRLRGNTPVDDFEGLQELMEEPQIDTAEQQETQKVDAQNAPDCGAEAIKELSFALAEPQEDVPAVESLQVDTVKEADEKEAVAEDQTEEPQTDCKTQDSMENTSLEAGEKVVAEEQPQAVEENLSEEQQPETATDITATETSATDPEPEATAAESSPEIMEAASNVTEMETTTTDPEAQAPVAENLPTVEEETADTAENEASDPEPEAPAAESLPETEEAISDITEVEQTVIDSEQQVPVTEKTPEVGEKTLDITEKETTFTDPEPKAFATETPAEVEEATLNATEIQPIASVPEPEDPACQTVPEVEEATSEFTEKETATTEIEKKPARGRRAKTMKATEDQQEATEQPQEPAVPVPVRGKRGKKTEAAAAPAVRQTTRGRNAKTAESKDDELIVETSEAEPSEAAVKPKRGRNAKKASEIIIQEAEAETKTAPEPESEPSPPAEIGQDDDVCAAPVEKAVVKPKRGRKAKQPEQAAPEQMDDVSAQNDDVPSIDGAKEADTNEVSSEKVELVPGESEKNRSADPMEAVSAAPITETVPEVMVEVIEVEKAVQKKPARGGRGKAVESRAEEKEEVTEQPEEPAPVRGRRGKKVEVTAPAAVRQTARGRNAKSQERSEDQPEAVETTEVSSEAVTELDHAQQEKQDSVPPTEIPAGKPTRGRKAKQTPVEQPQPEQQKTAEMTQAAEDSSEMMTEQKDSLEVEVVSAAVEKPTVKPTRGRKAKQAPAEAKPELEKTMEMTPLSEVSSGPVTDQKDAPSEEPVVKPTRGRKAKTPAAPQSEPEKAEDSTDELLPSEAEPQKPAPAAGKPRRGRKTKADTAEQNEETEVAAVAAETKQTALPPARAKRGRNAKQEEEKQESDEVSESQEPAKKVRRTRKAERVKEEPKEEAQTVEPVETVSTEEAETPQVLEAATVNEAAAPKPRRGGRKAKQDVETEAPAESPEVSEVAAVSTTEKPRRGRKGKQVAEEAEVAAVVPEEKPEEEPEGEDKDNAEPESPVIKLNRGRAQKTSVKKEAPKVTPAKRGRRGAAPTEETNPHSVAAVSESVAASAETPKRGRRAAAKPKTEDFKETSDQETRSEESSSAAMEETKATKRAVKWKPDLEVIEFPKETPVKAVRGRKSKLSEQVVADDKMASKNSNKPEEKDLSEAVVEAQPAKRARRGAKGAEEAESKSKAKSDEAETQPKTRRGRAAKK